MTTLEDTMSEVTTPESPVTSKNSGKEPYNIPDVPQIMISGSVSGTVGSVVFSSLTDSRTRACSSGRDRF